MSEKQRRDASDKQRRNDALNLIVAGGVALFSLLIGSSMLIGFLQEPEKAEDFLVLLGISLLFGGVGCGLYCFYILTSRVFRVLYYVCLGLTVAGYVAAVVAQAIYAT